MTSPYSLNRGPPELPELMAQSVCSRSMTVPELMVTVRSRALITPVVREKVSSPRGLPMAATGSPTTRESESPSTTVCSPEASIFSTARSWASSKPTTSAG